MRNLRVWVDEIEVEVTRKRVKNVNLRVHPPDGRVSVSVPHGLSMHSLMIILENKLRWIRDSREKVQAFHPIARKTASLPAAVFYGGVKYRVKYRASSGKGMVLCEDEGAFVVNHPLEWSKQKIITLLYSWFRSRLQEVIPERLAYWEEQVGERAGEWRIRKMRTRWGSCNITQRRIWISLYIIHYPLVCLDYVLLHELTHLLERNHNKRFYAYIDTHMPDWQTYVDWLKEDMRLDVTGL